MFDIGWQELFIVAVLTILVVGPKEIPRVLRAVTAIIRKFRGMTREFQRGIDDIVREADLDDMRKEMNDPKRWVMDDEIHKAIEEDGEMPELEDLKDSLEDAAREKPAEIEPPAAQAPEPKEQAS